MNQQTELAKSTEVAPLDNPYLMDYRELQGITNLIPDMVTPYLTSAELPDMPEGFKIYRIDSTDPLSDSAKAFEATVKQAKWNESRITAANESAPIDGNSSLFILLDENDKEPQIASTLRIADVTDGNPSETRAFFNRSFPETEMPEKLDVVEGEKTWDIVLVAAAKEYNDGKFTPWVYHALYRASLEQGVTKWIANINDHEHNNLDALRIPFKPVSNHVVEVNNSKGLAIPFRFYEIDVIDIESSMRERIVELTKKVIQFSQMKQEEIESLEPLSQLEVVASPLWLKAAQIALKGGQVFFDQNGELIDSSKKTDLKPSNSRIIAA